MLKYDKKNQFNLLMEAQRIVALRQQDALVKQKILDAIMNGWTPNEELFNEMIKDPNFNGNKDLIMDTILYMDLIGEPDKFIFYNYFAYCTKKMDANKYLENPYLKNIKFNKNFMLNHNNIQLKTDYFEKYEIQQSNINKRERNYISKPSIGYFDRPVEFPALLEDGDAWMTITPSEINTMEHHLEYMKGNVIVFGLGLGYFAYMSAIKDNVDSVTVIESNKDIIDIFNNNILNQMDDNIKSKISIIHNDAKEVFLEKDYMNSFDSCFIDIWKNSMDGAPLYSYFKENEKGLKIKPRYWIEEDIIIQYQSALMHYIIYILVKDLQDSKSSNEAYLMTAESNFFVGKIEKYFKKNKYIIRNERDICNLVFDNNIMNKILKLSK